MHIWVIFCTLVVIRTFPMYHIKCSDGCNIVNNLETCNKVLWKIPTLYYMFYIWHCITSFIYDIPTNHIYLINKKLTLVSHISIESWISISVPYELDVVKWYGFSCRFFLFIWYWFFFYQQMMILESINNIYLKFYFLHIFKKNALKIVVELPFNSTFKLKFSCSIGD